MHTRTAYEQSRREQALLHEELADRERALRDTRIGSIQKSEELKKDQEFRLEEFSIRKLVENHFKMSNLYAVDKYFTFQVILRYFLFLVNQEDCEAATKICSQMCGIRMVYRETFLQIHKRLLRQLIQECSIQGISLSRERFRCKQVRGNP